MSTKSKNPAPGTGRRPSFASALENWLAKALWRRYALTLVIASIGGGSLAIFSFPLAWLFGAMVLTVIATLAGLRLAMPKLLRQIVLTVLGVLIGSAFTPEILSSAQTWWRSALVLSLLIGLLTTGSYAFFRFVGRFDPTTAFFASTPGGMTEMSLVGEAYGADIRIVSLVHATRVALVVSLIPFYFRYVIGADLPSTPPTGSDIASLNLAEAMILIACGVAGFWFGRYLRLPAFAFLGPMTFSVAAHLVGISTAAPPGEAVATAQVVLGAFIGCRYAGFSLLAIWKTLCLAAGSSLIMIIVAAIFASIFAPMLDIDQTPLFLALVPGGVAEMGLIALALGLSTAYVSTMHIFRIILIVSLTPIIYRLLHKHN